MASGVSITMTAADWQDLNRAVRLLEQPSVTAKLADFAGQPVSGLLRKLPTAVNNKLRDIVGDVMLESLNVALSTLDVESENKPSGWLPKLMTGFTGGLSGLFGLPALAVELPITTTIMLRSIADIARHQGEDLSTLEARLACVEVFALGAPRESGTRADFGYYASRALLSRLTADAAALFLERSAASISAPVVGSLVSEIAMRFSVVVAERSAASALPVLGAVGGATINMMFMSHFQRVARGHFVVRRLEREHGVDAVRTLYDEYATRPVRAPRFAKRGKLLVGRSKS